MREYVDFRGSQSPYDAPKSADLAALARLVEVEVFLALASRPRCRGYETARDFIKPDDRRQRHALLRTA